MFRTLLTLISRFQGPAVHVFVQFRLFQIESKGMTPIEQYFAIIVFLFFFFFFLVKSSSLSFYPI